MKMFFMRQFSQEITGLTGNFLPALQLHGYTAGLYVLQSQKEKMSDFSTARLKQSGQVTDLV